MKLKFALWSAFVAYILAAAAPAEMLWFDPDAPVFHQDRVSGGVVYTYAREIKRPTLASYSVVVRRVGEIAPSCDGRGGPNEYEPTRDANGDITKLVAPANDLGYWAGNERCTSLANGEYYVTTVWKLERPLGDLLPLVSDIIGWVVPPKYITRVSEPFSVFNRT